MNNPILPKILAGIFQRRVAHSPQITRALTVRFTDVAVTVIADLPKKVEWDQRQLEALVTRIREGGENTADYVEISSIRST